MYPDSLRGGGAKRDGSCIGRECERLIVIAPRDIDSGTGADATFLEKFEQAAVAFVDAAHGIVLVWLGVRSQYKSTVTAAGVAFLFAEIAMRASAATAQFS